MNMDRSTLQPPDFVKVFGLPIWNPDYDQFGAWWQSALASPEPKLLGIVNAHTLNLAYEQPQYKDCLRRFDALINDGIGIRLASKMRKNPFRYNFNGTDLLPRLFSETTELRVFLYGATEVSNAGAAARIAEAFPSVQIVGRQNGFDGSEAEILDAINDSGANLLLVALGQPRQEFWLHENRERLNVPVSCGVGALFDFLSGSVKRAPEWMRSARVEWVYRLMLEPRRMFKRYVSGNPKFLARAARHRKRDRS